MDTLQKSDSLPGLTDSELVLLKKVFSSPLDIPNEWKAWLVAWLEANPPDLPINQSIGFENLVSSAIDNANTAAAAASAAAAAASAAIFNPVIATNESEVHFTGTSFATISGGPTITGLPNGTYVVWFGAAMFANAGDSVYMAVRANSSSDSAFLESQVGAHASVSRAITVTLSSGSNRLDGVYKCDLGHDNDQREGWMIALRTS